MKRILALLTLGAVLIVGLTNLVIAAEEPKGPQGQMSSAPSPEDGGAKGSGVADNAIAKEKAGTPNSGGNGPDGSGK